MNSEHGNTHSKQTNIGQLYAISVGTNVQKGLSATQRYFQLCLRFRRLAEVVLQAAIVAALVRRVAYIVVSALRWRFDGFFHGKRAFTYA